MDFVVPTIAARFLRGHRYTAPDTRLALVHRSCFTKPLLFLSLHDTIGVLSNRIPHHGARKMKKLKLNADALKVQSFELLAEETERGTVLGNSTHIRCSIEPYDTCNFTCEHTCETGICFC
jgi:hypothetical protein